MTHSLKKYYRLFTDLGTDGTSVNKLFQVFIFFNFYFSIHHIYIHACVCTCTYTNTELVMGREKRKRASKYKFLLVSSLVETGFIIKSYNKRMRIFKRNLIKYYFVLKGRQKTLSYHDA